HEKPGNFGMGNRNRPAFFDLRLKAGDYRAVGAQHISEPCSDKPSSSAQGAATIKRSTLAREVIEVSLYIDFSYSFRRAHHIGGINCFICGYHDEFFRAMGHGQACN